MRNQCRNLAAIALAILFAVLAPPLAAASERPSRFIDSMNLLTPEQAGELTRKLDEISERNQFDTVVAVAPALDHREARLHAIDLFEQSGFGFGNDLDGAILLLAMGERDFDFASLGYGLKVFTPDRQEQLVNRFLPHLRRDAYFQAFMAYADGVDALIAATAAEREMYRLCAIAISLGVALLIALGVTSAWKRQLVSVRRQTHAHAYIREGSMVLTAQEDRFLYRNVQKTRRVEHSSGGSSGSGGSFKSSSGRSATGRSGKF